MRRVVTDTSCGIASKCFQRFAVDCIALKSNAFSHDRLCDRIRVFTHTQSGWLVCCLDPLCQTIEFASPLSCDTKSKSLAPVHALSYNSHINSHSQSACRFVCFLTVQNARHSTLVALCKKSASKEVIVSTCIGDNAFNASSTIADVLSLSLLLAGIQDPASTSFKTVCSRSSNTLQAMM